MNNLLEELAKKYNKLATCKDEYSKKNIIAEISALHYRVDHKESRITWPIKWHLKTSARAIQQCVFCGEMHSYCARWPETVSHAKWCSEHIDKCAKNSLPFEV